MFFTTAVRCLAQRASHSSIDVGCAAAAVVGVEPAVVPLPAEAVGAALVDAAALSLLSSPPQLAATSASPMRIAPACRPGVRRTFPPLSGATPPGVTDGTSSRYRADLRCARRLGRARARERLSGHPEETATVNRG